MVMMMMIIIMMMMMMTIMTMMTMMTMTMMVTMTMTVMVMIMILIMIMIMMMIMDHTYIYILKVHRHGISKIRNPSAIPARSNVRVAPNMLKPSFWMCLKMLGTAKSHGASSYHQFSITIAI